MNAAGSGSRAARRTGGAQRRAILVLGMHRSGTSAVTRCLNLLGVDLGSRLMPAVEGNNPEGFWESMGAVEIHEKLLGNLDRSWNDARSLPEGWLLSGAARDAREQIAELIRDEFGNSRLWAIKDPRMCLFVPLWRETLARRGVDVSAILVARHPSEVAASLKARDMLPRDASHLIWFKHLACAEHATRGLPRSMVTYGSLLSNWRSVLARVASDLQLRWTVPPERAGPAIDAFLDKGRRHHVTSPEADTVPEVLTRMFEYCADLSAGKGGWEPVSRLVDDYRRVAEPLLAEMDSAVDLTSGFAGKDRAELYFRSQADVFSGDRACGQVHEWAEDAATLRFELPRDARATHLRFDPSLAAGAFHVSGVRVNGQAVANLRERVRTVKNHAFDRLDGTGVGFISFEDDPYVEFDMQDVLLATGDPVTVEVDCRKLDAASVASAEMVQHFSELRTELSGSTDRLKAAVARLEAGLATGSEREKRWDAQMDDLRARNAALNDELATRVEQENGALREAFRLSAKLVKIQEQFDAANVHGANLESRCAELETRSAESESRVAQLESDLAEKGDREATALREAFWLSGKNVRASEQLDAVRGSLAELEARYGALAGRLHGQQTLNAGLQTELAEIKRSTLWRVLVRVRGLLLKIPRGARSLLRRGLKMTWWVLTPWRIPARIRFLRSRTRARQDPDE